MANLCQQVLKPLGSYMWVFTSLRGRCKTGSEVEGEGGRTNRGWREEGGTPAIRTPF